jgi:lipopolysaccharide transport system ATP-binding protein
MDGFRLRRLEPHLYAYTLRLPRLPLLPGRYVARSHAMDPEGMRMFDHVELRFDVAGTSRETGFVRLGHEWS